MLEGGGVELSYKRRLPNSEVLVWYRQWNW